MPATLSPERLSPAPAGRTLHPDPVTPTRLTIVLPALNEEDTIGLVIDEVPTTEMEEKGYRTTILVVNNGSTDRTGHVAIERGARGIEEPRR